MSAHREIGERGIALLAALMMVFILSLLGMTSLHLANQELIGTKVLQEEHMAHHAAEAAVEMVMEWFHEPGALLLGPESRFFSKQMIDGNGQLAFVDARGISQFRGTEHAPDILFDAANPQHDPY